MKKFICLGLSLLWFNTSLAAVQEIDVSDMKFTPSTIDINQGDTVRWINRDTVSHDVQGNFGSSGSMSPGQRFEFVFTTAGNFDYLCSIHPAMTGTIRVAAVTVVENTTEDNGAVNFSDLFGTGNDLVVDDLSETANMPQLEDTNSVAQVSVTTPAPIVPPQVTAPQTVVFNDPVVDKTIAKAAQSNAILPTAGGDNRMIYLAVLALIGMLMFLSGLVRR